MNSELLRGLGVIAGIGGISLGVFLLLFRQLIAKTIFAKLDKTQSFEIIKLILILVWSVAVLGIIVWLISLWKPVQEKPTFEARGGFGRIEAGCSPIIRRGKEDESGFVVVDVECGLEDEELAKASKKALSSARHALFVLGGAQRHYLLPAFKRYEENPNQENWQLVIEQLRSAEGFAKAAKNAAIIYYSTLPDPKDDVLGDQIHSLLFERFGLLQKFKDETGSYFTSPPEGMSVDDFVKRAREYEGLMGDLGFKLTEIEKRMRAQGDHI